MRKAGRVRIWLAGLLIMAGAGLGWQSLVQADAPWGDGNQQSIESIKSGVSDYAMFGKTLESAPVSLAHQITELKPGSGPVVPVQLRIPALSINTTVEPVSLLKSGAMDVPNNIWSAGWLQSNPRPGDIGNAVIDGHKDSTRGGAIFWNLGQLKVGDKIYVSDDGGYELTFAVTEVTQYDTDQAPLDRIFGPTDSRQLNLISCAGTFLHDQYTYDQRVVVYTQLVTNQ